MADNYTMADVLAGMTDTYGRGPYPEAEPPPQTWEEFIQRTHRMPALLQIPYKAAESVRGILSGDLAYQPGVRRADVTDVPAPTGPTQDSTRLGRLLGVPPVAWEPNDPYIEGTGDIAGLMVGSGPAGSGSVGSGAAYRQGFSERMAAGKEANARFADRPAYARAQAPEGAPNQPPLLAPGETRGDLVRALGAEPAEVSIGDIGREAYREVLANPPPKSIAAVGKQAYDDTLTGFTLGSGSKKAAPATLTLEQFNDLARGGRMRMAGEPGELKPSKAALDKAETAVDYGRLYGYSEADIARFYQERRGGHPLGYQEYARDFANAKVPPVAPKATTEMTPIGEQYVLPGAERETQARTLQRLADEKLKPTVAQKAADEGLFAGPDTQLGFDLGSGSKRAAPAIIAAHSMDDVVGPPMGVGSPRLRNPNAPLFDYSRMGERVDTPQFGLTRTESTDVTPDFAKAGSKANIARVNKIVEQGIKEGGLDWHNMLPLLDEYTGELGSTAGRAAFNTYMDRVGATSPNSNVMQNFRTASYYDYLLRNGLPLPKIEYKASTGNPYIRPGVIPYPYGNTAQGLHVMNLNALAEGGYPLSRPKPPSFAENMKGNYTPVAIDRHNLTLWGIDRESPNLTGYRFLEDLQQQQARRMGIDPAQYQAAGWLPYADSGAVPALKLFEQRIAQTAEQAGLTKAQVLREFIRGKMRLQ